MGERAHTKEMREEIHASICKLCLFSATHLAHAVLQSAFPVCVHLHDAYSLLEDLVLSYGLPSTSPSPLHPPAVSVASQSHFYCYHYVYLIVLRLLVYWFAYTIMIHLFGRVIFVQFLSVISMIKVKVWSIEAT